jgi:tellurium resistance protein TerD
MSTISLLSGQNMSLPQGAPLLIRFAAQTIPSNYELDSCAFMLNQQGKVRSDADFIFFNQPVFCAGVMQKQVSGHQFIINPQLLPADITKVVFSLTIYDGFSKKQNFSALSSCRGEIINNSNNHKIAEFTLDTHDKTEIALIFFVLYQHNTQWKVRALGNGFNGGLEALTNYFGVDISEGEVKTTEEEIIKAELKTSISVESIQSIEEKVPVSKSRPITKKNPLDIAKELQSTLIEAKSSISMADIPKRQIEQMIEVTGKMVAALNQIHNAVVPLDLISDEAVLVANLTVWHNLPSGYIFRKDIKYQRLINNSKTLNTLHKNAIDILSVYKFSDEEIALSKNIGDFFSVNFAFFRSFKFLITKNELGTAYLTARVKEASEINGFLQHMEKFKVIAPYKIQLFVLKTREWVDSDVGTLRRIRSQDNKIRFNIDIIDTTTYCDLITGHWFNAFAYSIISDHLTRNQLLHELYTRVSYQSPTEIFKSRGDFDIIAMVGKTILAVECKSGNLKESIDVDTIIDKKRGLEKVFEIAGSGSYRYLFLIIYNPFAYNDQVALDKLAAAGIRPVIPSEMRGVVFDIFSALFCL